MLVPVFNVKSIYTIHYFKYGRHFSFPPESHNFWEMVYVDSGTALIRTENGNLTLKQGEAVFHAPNIEHTISTEEGPANAAIISFECNSRTMKSFRDKTFIFGDKEKAILNEIINEGSKTYQEKLNDPHLSKMTKREDASFASEQLIKNNIENLLIYLLRNRDSNKIPQQSTNTLKTDELAEKIIAILKSKVYETITLEEISKILYFSKTYIKTVFKKHTGTSVIQYFIDLKTEEAKRLIAENKYSFTEISDMLAFNSVHYFSRLFKQRTDMTPTEYANSIKVDNLIK